jgi:hypothetical protein
MSPKLVQTYPQIVEIGELQWHSLYAHQKTAETITNKTTKTFVKKSSFY